MLPNNSKPLTSEGKPVPLKEVRNLDLFVVGIPWVITTLGTVIILSRDLAGQTQIKYLSWGLGALYSAALIWYLSRTGPVAASLPDLQPLIFPKMKFRGMVASLTALLFLGPILITMLIIIPSIPIGGNELVEKVNLYFQPWVVLEVTLAGMGIAILITWRRRLRTRLVISGMIVGLLAGSAELVQFLNTGAPFDIYWAIVQVICVPPAFIAGGLLLGHSGVGQVRLLNGNITQVVKSLLTGCIVFLPLGLVNTADGIFTGFDWMDSIQEPLIFSWLPALAEETWARLFLVTLCYSLLRPLSNDRPGRVFITAALLSALAHGFLHGLDLNALLITGLIYLLPMAVLFIKRDWEQAVGAHYVVNLISFLAILFR
jgi:hypothetical protein